MKKNRDPFKNLKLDAYEREIERELAKGSFKPTKISREEMKKYQEAARYTLEKLKKTENINIRLSQQDLTSLKARAIEAGLPYQTLIAALLHQYASGKIEASL